MPNTLAPDKSCIVTGLDSIEQVALSQLVPSPRNPRRHSEANVTKIARSIVTYGWTTPVLITDAMEVIAGHGRLLAAEHLGIDEVPCIRLSHLTPQLVEAYRIADNRLALDSEWDEELLASVIGELHADSEFDLTLTGFESDEIDEFLNSSTPEPTTRELSESEENTLDKAWCRLLEDWNDIVTTAKERDWISTSYTKGALAVLYLRSLYFGDDIDRSATLAYTKNRIFISADSNRENGSIPELFQNALSKRSLRDSIRWQLRDQPDFDYMAGGKSLPIHGYRAPVDFPALLARDLINEFCPNSGRVLDPCHGWGGRMLGFLLSDKAVEYVGCDPAPQTSQGVQSMFDDLSALTPKRIKSAKLFCSPFETTTDIERASFDFALTSPPYYDVEKYDGAQSSWCLYKTFDDWVTGFYQPLLARVSDALKPGAVFALQVGSQSYPLKQLAVKLAKQCGLRHVETRRTEITNTYAETDPDEGEVIVILERAAMKGALV